MGQHTSASLVCGCLSMILLIIIASFVSSLVSRGDLVTHGAAVLVARSAPLVALSALSVIFGRACPFIVISIFSICKSICYFH
jgi:hypothetical protein